MFAEISDMSRFPPGSARLVYRLLFGLLPSRRLIAANAFITESTEYILAY